MPLLGSVNAGIYRNQDVIPWPGQQTAQSGQPPRADTPLMRLGLEQQKEQQINAIFQKHGTDYDAAVEEVMGIDPEKGQQLAGLLADGRKKGAEQHKAETESSLKNLEMVGHGIEMAIQDPTQYPKLLDFVSKQPGGSEYLKFAPDPNDPELVPKLKALLPAVLGPKDFLKVTADAAQDYIDGDKQLAAAKTLAAAVTPEQRKIADKWLVDGGLKDFSQMWPDAPSAAAARDAMLEQKVKEKPATEKAANIGSFEDYMTADPAHRAQILTDRKAYNQADDKPRAGGGAGGGGTGPEIQLKPGTRHYRIAQDMAYGRIGLDDFSRMFGRSSATGPLREAMYDTARQLNPNFNPRAFEMGYKYAGRAKTQDTLVGIDNALANFDKAVELSNQVGRFDAPTLNRLFASGKFQFGNTPITNFQQFKTILADDVALAIGQGAPSDYKTQLAQSLVDTNLSKENFLSTLRQSGEFLQNRKRTILNQEGPYGTKEFNPSAGVEPPKVMQEGGPQQKPIPGVPGGIAELRNGRWIRVK